MRLRAVHMDFLYGTTFLSQSPEAYERLILDAMRGDATLFTRGDEVEAQWRICDPVVRLWDRTPGSLPRYPAGSGRAPPRPPRSRVLATRGAGSEAAVPEPCDMVWSSDRTTPAQVESVLRAMLIERHGVYAGCVPARTLNLVCVVDGPSRAAHARTAASEPRPRPCVADDRLLGRARAS